MNESMTSPESHTTSLLASWAGLVMLTMVSYWFRDHGIGASAALTVILVLTFIKVYIVGHSFMELRRAPRALRAVFAGWCAGTCLCLIILAFSF